MIRQLYPFHRTCSIMVPSLCFFLCQRLGSKIYRFITFTCILKVRGRHETIIIFHTQSYSSYCLGFGHRERRTWVSTERHSVWTGTQGKLFACGPVSYPAIGFNLEGRGWRGVWIFPSQIDKCAIKTITRALNCPYLFCRSVTLSPSNNKDSWILSLKRCLDESELELEDFPDHILDKGSDGYEMLEPSQKLRLLTFLCDESLSTK